MASLRCKLAFNSSNRLDGFLNCSYDLGSIQLVVTKGIFFTLLICAIVNDTSLVAVGNLQSDIEVVRLATSLEGFGCAGFEFFEFGSAAYIASANFWDGHNEFMAANSSLFQVRVRSDINGKVDLNFHLTQEFLTHGAHGVDHFRLASESSFKEILIIPSYYECERSNHGCKSTLIYSWNQFYHKFENVKSLKSGGPSQTDHFATNGTV